MLHFKIIHPIRPHWKKLTQVQWFNCIVSFWLIFWLYSNSCNYRNSNGDQYNSETPYQKKRIALISKCCFDWTEKYKLCSKRLLSVVVYMVVTQSLYSRNLLLGLYFRRERCSSLNWQQMTLQLIRLKTLKLLIVIYNKTHLLNTNDTFYYYQI